ncbi:AAA family ATPase [Streptomyces sp. NPDC035033]|uniref:AAA family ATPase n=1 Tax=Streptomyces sp. NPDC035033 TaxID=3155368 RepID=UPI0033FB04AA
MEDDEPYGPDAGAAEGRHGRDAAEERHDRAPAPGPASAPTPAPASGPSARPSAIPSARPSAAPSSAPPVAPPAAPPSPGPVRQWAQASGDGRTYQAGHDQHFSRIETQNVIETQHVWAPGGGPAPRALAALPPAPALTGREGPTAALLRSLGPEGPAVTVVTGLPGVGKTALALHAAHRAVALGHFPGGTLFVRLRGYDPAGAVAPEQALEALLRALGVRDDDLPPTPEEQAALYRSELARRADRHGPVLIVADDASTTAQLAPLTPAHPAHRLLATSRHALTDPDFRPRLLPLDELDTASATALLATALAQVDPADPRVGEEPRALEEVAVRCGRLPLALTIAAALLTYDPGLRVGALAHELSDARTRLRELRYEDGDGRSFAVRTAFGLSYRRLREPEARLFRLLSLNPGPDLSTEAATALTDRPARETRGSLAALARACLLGEQPVGSGRWRMHDLLRLYAAERRADAELREGPGRVQDHEAARDRLLTYYLKSCEEADRRLRAEDDGPGRAAALAWLEAERPNLVQAIALATTEAPLTALRLATAISAYLRRTRHLHDTHAADEYVVAAALRGGGPVVVDRADSGWGRGVPHALDHRALDSREIARLRELAPARELEQRGAERWVGGRHDEAAAAFTEAADIYRAVGSLHEEGSALDALGLVLHEARRFTEAAAAHARALGAYRRAHSLDGEARSLDHLGLALGEAGRFAEAAVAHEQAADRFRAGGSRADEAAARRNLDRARRALEREE